MNRDGVTTSPGTPGPEDVASSTPTQVWSEPDRTMHQLLESAFENGRPEGTPTHPGEARRWPDITPFLNHEEASFPGVVTEDKLTPGRCLGRFLIERELGRGGFGIVYLAFDARLGRHVALKVPRPDRVQNAALWGRFAREARLAATLDHEAIVPVLDAGVIDGVFFIATSYQEGETLSRWLARSPGGLAPRLAAALVEQLAAGLAHAHGRGVLHRDLTPGNVLMVPESSTHLGVRHPRPSSPAPQPRITDYGLGAFREGEEPGTSTGLWQGSPPYMAPEQVLKLAGPVDARADLYALGAILYEMLTGQPIYPCRSIAELGVQLHRGDPPIAPRQLRRGVPRDLETVCLKCLERDPARRYASAEALQDDLHRYLAGRPIVARPVSPWGRLSRWARRNPSRAALAGLSIITLASWLGLATRHQIELAEANSHLSRINHELLESVKQRDSSYRRLTVALDDIRLRDLAQVRQRYADDMRSAASLLAGGCRESAQLVLRRQVPRAGEDDPREFAWHHLWAEATRDYTVHGLGEPSAIFPDPARWAERAYAEESRPRRLSQLAGWLRIDPSGLRVDDWTGSHLLTRRGISAHLALDKKMVWYGDVEGLEPVARMHGRPLLSPDGRVLVLSDLDWYADVRGATLPLAESREVLLRSGSTLKVVRVPASFRMAFSADGRTLACLAYDAASQWPCMLVIYDLATGRGRAFPKITREQLVVEFPGEDRGRRFLTAMALSPDGRRVALNHQSTHIQVIDTRDGRSLWKVGAELFGPKSLVTALSFSPEGRRLVSGDMEGRARLWDSESGQPRGVAPFITHPVAAVGFYPDGGTVAAVADAENSIRYWTIAPHPEPPAALDHGDEVWGLDFLPGGTILASAGDDHLIRLWDVARGALVRTIAGHETIVSAQAVSPDGGLLASADFNGRVRLWDLGAIHIETPGRSLDDFPGKVRTLAWSPDGRYLAIGGNATVIHVWERDADRLLRIVPPHGDTFALAWSPDGSTLAAGSHDRKISLWRWPDRSLERTIETRDQIACLDFGADGKTLVAGDAVGGLQTWSRVGSGLSAESSERASGVGGVWGLALSPDGRTIATGGDDGSVRLWDPSCLRELCRLSRPPTKLHSLAFSSNGKLLASADFKGLISLHRTGTSECDSIRLANIPADIPRGPAPVKLRRPRP